MNHENWQRLNKPCRRNVTKKVQLHLTWWKCIYCRQCYCVHDTQSPQISQKQDEHNMYNIMKTIYLPGYHHNGFVATHALGYMMYGYTLPTQMNQGVLNKLSKEHNISSHKLSTTHRVLKSHRSKMNMTCIYIISWRQCAFPVIASVTYNNNNNDDNKSSSKDANHFDKRGCLLPFIS